MTSLLSVGLPPGVSDLTEAAAEAADNLRAGHRRAERALERLRERSQTEKRSGRAELAGGLREGLRRTKGGGCDPECTVCKVQQWVMQQPHEVVELA